MRIEVRTHPSSIRRLKVIIKKIKEKMDKQPYVPPKLDDFDPTDEFRDQKEWDEHYKDFTPVTDNKIDWDQGKGTF